MFALFIGILDVDKTFWRTFKKVKLVKLDRVGGITCTSLCANDKLFRPP